MIKISVDRKAAEGKLGRMATVGKALDPVKQSARFIREKVADSFDQQRDPWGNRWVPLSDATLSLRRREGNVSTQILNDKGDMRASLRTRDDTVEIRTPAEFHQSGATISIFGQRRGILPRRAILPIDPDGQANLPDAWANEIIGFFNDWLERQ